MNRGRSGPRTEAELDDLLSEPTSDVVAAVGRLRGDILFLGAAGKMGPSLARMAKRATDAARVRRRIVAVSRFTNGGEDAFHSHGIETIRCDLLDEADVVRLPDSPNVVYMAGMKFGATGNEAATWAMNAFLPGVVCRKFRTSRIVAFSTGNVYGLVPTNGAGSREGDVPLPVGEYAMSCLGRERIFEHFGRVDKIPTAIIRLNYACDLRYGVLVDLAGKVRAGEPIDLTMGYFNTLWQGDANAMTLRAFDRVASPAWIVNVTGPERLSVRAVATRLGSLLGRPPRFAGTEAPEALLAEARSGLDALGSPRVPADQLIDWVADWVAGGGRSLGKPTKFESREGTF